MSESITIPIIALVVLVLLVIFMAGGSYMEHKHVPVGHETGLIIFLGLIVSFLIYFFDHEGKFEIAFDGTVFFYFLLPPIVFSSGFNMRRKRFFENIGYIFIFGILGTLIQFLIFSVLTWSFQQGNFMTKYDFTTKISEPFVLSPLECMLISSLICSSDVIAAISIIKYEEQPKLFSLIFGEGITNDAVSIILFNTVSEFLKSDNPEEFSAKTPFKIIGNFIVLALGSLGIGILFGLVASAMFKNMRFLTVSAVRETAIIFCIAYISYCVGEAAEMSGIISLLTTGVLMAHYTWFSLSPQGKHVTSVTFAVIGFLTEAFVFVYLGIAFFSYVGNTNNAGSFNYKWSFQLILIELLVVIVGRICGTVGLIYLLVLFGHKKQVSLNQLCFISYAGMIRGAVSFGLVLTIQNNTFIKNRDVIITTVLALVVITTIIFGSFTSMVQKALVPPIMEDKHEYDELEIVDDDSDEEGFEDLKRTAELGEKQKQDVEIRKKKSKARVMSIASIHEEFIHPNLEKSHAEPVNLDNLSSVLRKKERKIGCCNKYMGIFDNKIMKPLFIYKYSQDKEQLRAEFMELFEKDGAKWEALYMSQQPEIDEHQIGRSLSVFRHIGSMAQKSRAASIFKNTLTRNGSHVSGGKQKYPGYRSIVDNDRSEKYLAKKLMSANKDRQMISETPKASRGNIDMVIQEESAEETRMNFSKTRD